MRKLEEEMIHAMFSGREWKGTNTTVSVSDGVSQIRLWGNLIAEYSHVDYSLKMSSCGYATTTTRSRLSAIATACCVPGRVTTLHGYMHIVDGHNKEIFDL